MTEQQKNSDQLEDNEDPDSTSSGIHGRPPSQPINGQIATFINSISYTFLGICAAILLFGFGAGYKTREVLLEDNNVILSKIEHAQLDKKSKRVEELEQEVSKLKAIKGVKPDPENYVNPSDATMLWETEYRTALPPWLDKKIPKESGTHEETTLWVGRLFDGGQQQKVGLSHYTKPFKMVIEWPTTEGEMEILAYHTRRGVTKDCLHELSVHPKGPYLVEIDVPQSEPNDQIWVLARIVVDKESSKNVPKGRPKFSIKKSTTK